MCKKGIILLLVGLYLASLVSCFFYARHYVRKKDARLYSNAISSLKSYFRGRDRIIVVEYSGQKVRSEQVPLRKFKDDFKNLDHFYKSAELSKKEYLWKEAYDDIYKRYEIIPRYQRDYNYTGFLFRVFEKGYDHVAEYTLYPKYVGFKKQSSSWEYQWMPSVQEDVDEAYSFFTTNEESNYYGDFWRDKISKYDIARAVENEYYELWSYKRNSGMVNFTIQESANLGKGDYFMGMRHPRAYYELSDFDALNELGYYTWFSNGYCRVYLEAYPRDILTLRYRFVNFARKHPMLMDMERICFWGLVVLTVIFGAIITLVAIKKR